MNRIILFLNGEKPQKIPCCADYELVVCADGAYQFLVEVGIKPDLIIGDFDSIEQLPDDVPHIHTPDQNFTDFEKAIKIIIEKGYKHMDVFAASGLEQDHFLGNLTTALKYRKKIKIIFFDDRQTYYFIKKKIVLNQVKNKIVSLFPFPKAKNIYSHGLKYPLKGLDMEMTKNQIGTRNIAIQNTVKIKFSKGNLLLFIDR